MAPQLDIGLDVQILSKFKECAIELLHNDGILVDLGQPLVEMSKGVEVKGHMVHVQHSVLPQM